MIGSEHPNFFEAITHLRDSLDDDAFRRYRIDRQKFVKDFCDNRLREMSPLEEEIQKYLEKRNG